MQEKLTAGAERFIRAVTEFIYVEDPPEKADVIFVPGSRKIEHALRAAELYCAGYAPYVLPSGRYTIKRGYFLDLPEPLKSEYPGSYETEWAFLREVLMRHGVPDHAILREDQATYTWENAQLSRDVLKDRGIPCRTAILACQAFHARRALLYYQAAMPHTRFIVCPAGAAVLSGGHAGHPVHRLPGKPARLRAGRVVPLREGPCPRPGRAAAPGRADRGCFFHDAGRKRCFISLSRTRGVSPGKQEPHDHARRTPPPDAGTLPPGRNRRLCAP